ncbi:hypothetical protein CMV30_04485 [Nibricoccus aquaticus]|uniref:DUF502 domain-containing protein n=1 Tax=Nibricoccus aquaticus TaxID=2576891 RepID=A0A290Q7X4_9BACT|nr:DUF502 domain-containing protein [Nibricoccus aquaticus]ATC63270.1 hypothetical protein CMV30_04485 [Nibricoccus aquaticus]
MSDSSLAPAPAPGPSRFATLRNAFLSGLLLLTPITITWIVFSALFERVGGGFRDYFFFFVPADLRDHESLRIVWNIVATFIIIVLITLLGWVSRYVLGQYFGSLAERFVQNIPGVSAVYNTVKQIVDTFGTQNRNLFNKVVLVEFPRPGVRTIGFLTNKTQGEPSARTGLELLTVFVPTTPNPTGGYLLLFPKNEVIELDMPVGEAMKMIISGGAVIPPWPPAAKVTPPTLP